MKNKKGGKARIKWKYTLDRIDRQGKQAKKKCMK